MKNLNIAFLVVMGCFFTSDLFAQEHKIVPTGPTYPLVNYGMTRVDVNIDTQCINYAKVGNQSFKVSVR